MTLSDLHENIIDDFRSVVTRFHSDKNDPNQGIAIEHMIAAAVCPTLKNIGMRADCYLFPNDGYATIPVEVGRMNDDKWDHVYDAVDNKKCRVLRIDFNKNIHMLHTRNTDYETRLIAYLDNNGFES